MQENIFVFGILSFKSDKLQKESVCIWIFLLTMKKKLILTEC